MPDFNNTNIPQYHRVAFGALQATSAAHGVYCEAFQLQRTPTHVEDKGVYGKAWGRSENVIEDKIVCSGPITFRPRRDNIEFLLAAITGGTGGVMGVNGDPFPVVHDNTLGLDTFLKSKIDVATFSSSKADTILKLVLQIEALNMTSGSGNLSAATFSTERLFVHTQTTVTIDGVDYNTEDISIAINRNLIKDEHLNSKTRVDLPDGERIVTLTTNSPFNTSDDKALQALGDSSVEASVLYTNGEYDLLFEFPALQSPVASPIFSGRGPVRQGITWQGRSLDGHSFDGPLKISVTAVNP